MSNYIPLLLVDGINYPWPDPDACLDNILIEMTFSVVQFHIVPLVLYEYCKRQHILQGFLDAEINMIS